MILLKSIFGIPLKDYALIFRIYFLLYKTKWMIFNKSFEKIINWISTDLINISYHQSQYVQVVKIRNYTRSLSKLVPFKSLCYDRALTAKRELNRLNIYSEIHFGLDTTDKQMKGHVWIICNEMIVIGEESIKKYKSVRYFS